MPAFVLYGESLDGQGIGVDRSAEMLHVESLQSRSQLYRWEIAAHVHQGLHQILWVHRGSVEADLDEWRLHREGPVAVTVPPGTVHAFRFAPGSEGYVLTLNPRSMIEGDAAASALLQALFEAPRLLAFDDAGDAARIDALFAVLLAEFNAPGLAGAPVPTWLARAVVWRLARAAQVQGLAAQVQGPAQRGPAHAPPQRGLFPRFVALVEAHYTAHWPVSRYASMLGLSTERLNRLVRAQTGRSALQVIHDRVLREACRRLVYIAAPVSALAYELGFEDAAYFCRFFKRHTGLAPSVYRARQESAPTIPATASGAPRVVRLDG